MIRSLVHLVAGFFVPPKRQVLELTNDILIATCRELAADITRLKAENHALRQACLDQANLIAAAGEQIRQLNWLMMRLSAEREAALGMLTGHDRIGQPIGRA